MWINMNWALCDNFRQEVVILITFECNSENAVVVKIKGCKKLLFQQMDMQEEHEWDAQAKVVNKLFTISAKDEREENVREQRKRSAEFKI